MALAPGWRTISSCPWDPSGNLTVSTSRLITRPWYFRSVEIRLIGANMGRGPSPHKGLEHRPEPNYRNLGGFGEQIGKLAAELARDGTGRGRRSVCLNGDSVGLEAQAEGMEWVTDQERTMEGSLPQPLCDRSHRGVGRAAFWTNDDVGLTHPIEDQ